jgi:hypothetical protein
MNTAAKEEVYGAVNMTANKGMEFLVSQTNTKTEDTTWSIAHNDCMVSQLEREIYGITSNMQMQFKKDLSICLIEFEPWRQVIRIQQLRKTIEQHVTNFGYSPMLLVRNSSESV